VCIYIYKIIIHTTHTYIINTKLLHWFAVRFYTKQRKKEKHKIRINFIIILFIILPKSHFKIHFSMFSITVGTIISNMYSHNKFYKGKKKITQII